MTGERRMQVRDLHPAILIPRTVDRPMPQPVLSHPSEPDPDIAGAGVEALERALALAPFYRRWRPFDPGPDATVDARFAALPALAKRDLRAHMPKGFVPTDRNLRAGMESGEVELVSTSGTTEDRSSVVWHQPWWDRSEQSAASLHSGLDQVVRRLPREAVLTTPLCGGTVCHVGALSQEDRTLGRLLFLNQQADPTRWTAAEMDRMLNELARFQPELLEADPAYLAILSRHAAEQGVTPHQPRFITLTYEFPSRAHLRQIRRAFPAVSVLSSYGSTETGHVFVECEAGFFHQNTSCCRVDFQPVRPEVGDPRIGRILITQIGNSWLSLLRFDVGDLVRTADRPCPCGRAQGLTLESIEGRTRDATFATDRRLVTVGALDRAIGALPGLLSYRLEQSAPNEYTFSFVAEPGAEAAVAGGASAPLLRLYGAGARIAVQREAVIGAEQSGKFRLARALYAWETEEIFDL